MGQQIMLYLQNNASSYIASICEHISISVISLLIAMLLGIPAGYACVRYERSKRAFVSFFQALRVIPSLAVLLLLIPVMGTGARPAITALVILAVPPVLINTVAGLEEVPSFMLETARGCGMTSGQVWLKVRFPLAAPIILTGVKTALIEIIASATLASKIGAGGLGDIIFTGLGLDRFDLLLIGGVTVAVLSVGSGLLMDMLDRRLLRYNHINNREDYV